MTPAETLARILPDTAGTSRLGHLVLGGCDAVQLAADFGTPLFVYDEIHLRNRCRAARAAFPGGVSYAAKAFLCRAMAALVHDEGLTLDVASAGEFVAVRTAGVPPQRIVVHGNNKSEEELRLSLGSPVHRLVIDSLDELDRVCGLVADGYPPPDVWLRVNPAVDPVTHRSISTGQADSKFGLPLGSAATHAVARLAASSGAVRLRGLHLHLGSQIRDLDVYAQAARKVVPHLRAWGLSELCVGGGLAVPYTCSEASPTVGDLAAAARRPIRESGLDVTVSAELGRWIAATAAVTLYSVGVIKAEPGARTFVSVDGGMSENLRVALYGADYEMLAAASPHRRERAVTVVGKHCESGDVLARDALLPAGLRAGDILCSPVTGAYGYSMASWYNRLGRPAVVFVRDGAATPVLRRESAEDMLRLDLLAPTEFPNGAQCPYGAPA